MTCHFEKTTEIRFPMFNYTVHVIKSTDLYRSRNDRAEMIGELMSEYDASHTAALAAFNPDKPRCFLFFTDDVKVGEVAHECWHAVWEMMEWIGASLENEVCAYLLDYLVEETWEFVKT